MFITPTVNSFESRHAHYSAYTSYTAGADSTYCTLPPVKASDKRRTAKLLGASVNCASGAVKESVKKRLVAKIVKMLTVKEKNDSVAKLKKCIARNTKLYATTGAGCTGRGAGCRYGAARWRRYAGQPTADLAVGSIGALCYNFEPLLPTIVEETEFELRNENI